MKDKTKITAAIYHAIDEINKQLPVENKITKDEKSSIIIKGLDSLHQVNFLLYVEEQLQLDCGLEIDLAASMSASAELPFTNVGELAEYVFNHAGICG
jgi:hypothetical protein